MTRTTIGLLAVVLLAACQDAPTSSSLAAAAGPSRSAAVFTESSQIPVSLLIDSPCGGGEPVLVSGDLHMLFHVTVSDAGTVVIKSHFQPMGLSGQGLVTGAKFQATGVTQDILVIGAGGLPFTYTFVNNFRIIGQGPDNNFLVHDNYHITVNENGEVTAVHDNFSLECQ